MSSSKGHSNMNSNMHEFEPEIEFERQYEPLEVQAAGSAGQGKSSIWLPVILAACQSWPDGNHSPLALVLRKSFVLVVF